MKKDFLQSNEWRKFQEAVGHRTFCITSPQLSPSQGEGASFCASIIEHSLPIAGKYFYVPRGPISQDLISLAKKEKAGWIRFDATDENVLDAIKNNAGEYKIEKAPHNMQPRQVFVIDIAKSEEELLSEMKSKTRYNIRLAEKKGVLVRITNGKDINEFLRLNRIMAARQGIKTHPDEYYRKMFEMISGDILKLYVAEYKGNIIAANIVTFYKGTATYLHGASDDKFKNLMAPYLLQWQAIKDAKKVGCGRYDFGGVSDNNENWKGITRFKLGFSPATAPTQYAGSYDIIINSVKYQPYRMIQKIKTWIK